MNLLKEIQICSGGIHWPSIKWSRMDVEGQACGVNGWARERNDRMQKTQKYCPLVWNLIGFSSQKIPAMALDPPKRF